MRWRFSLILLLIASACVALSGASVQARSGRSLVPPPDPSQNWPEAHEPTNDLCEEATALLLIDSFSDQVLVKNATTSPSDPPQSCSWGGPAPNIKSLWWEVSVPEDGRLTVTTIGQNPYRYDTVVTIYRTPAGCGDVAPETEVGCDDDRKAFQSEATALVSREITYLVEVTAWEGATLVENPVLDLWMSFEPDSRWQNPTGAAMQLPLVNHLSLSDGRYLYLLGGEENGGVSAAVQRYDPASREWTWLADTPQAYRHSDGAHVDGNLYVPAGDAGADPGEPFAAGHYVYDIGSGNWSVLAPMTATTPLSEPVAWSAAAADPAASAYYVTGGVLGSAPAEPLGTALRYNIASDTWDQLADMITARYDHRAALIEGELCVIGGRDAAGEPLDRGECMNLQTGKWDSIDRLNLPRASFGAAVGLDGRWYVFGGVTAGDKTTPKTEVYDRAADQWTPLNERWSLPVSRYGLGGAQVGMELHATGGRSDELQPISNRIEWLTVGSEAVYLPLISNTSEGDGSRLHECNDAFPFAYGPVAAGTTLQSNFALSNDKDDLFYVDLEDDTDLQVDLGNIPAGSNYDLYLYGNLEGNAKYMVGSSTNLAASAEQVTANDLPAGRYIIWVENKTYASSELYQLQVQVW